MKTTDLKQHISTGKMDQQLMNIYSDASLLEYQKGRYCKLIEEFEQHFGTEEAMILSTPGRSEITGNHTDHQRGSILACSVNLDLVAVAAPADDLIIYSSGTLIKDLDINNIEYKKSEEHTSTALVKGVLYKLQEYGHKIGGMHAVITSNVLVGSGLSSSAAFEDMIGIMTSYLYNDGNISKVEISKAAQFAENKYFGKPSGLMDQVACAMGGIVYVDFKDKENPEIKQVDVDFNSFGYSLCIVNTGGSHSNLTDDYADITKEMKLVSEFFHKDVLREVPMEEVIKHIPELREKCGDRSVLRALHMLTEQNRVLKQLDNLESRDFPSFLATIQDSGNSSFKFLQNVYTINDTFYQPLSLGILMSEIILKDQGVVRVHGGGFAGTIQVFVRNEYVKTYKEEIEKVFGQGSCMTLQVNNLGATRVA